MPRDARDLELEAHFSDDPAPSFFVDWSTFWERDRTTAEWLIEDVLARGRAHALYASHKQGKSLLVLTLVAGLVTSDPNVVAVYLDYEMGEDDLYERLEEMGYGAESDLARLKYALLPTLPPLDTQAGSDVLMSTLDAVEEQHPGCHLVVVIDTTSRAVQGDENSADTIRAFYRHTGLALKQRGVTWARLDHAGKDADKGQRGSSAKGDDVDVVWRLNRTEDGVKLTRDLSRMTWVPQTVTFHQADTPLRFVRTSGGWPAGTKDLAGILDALNVPTDTGWRDAAKALKDAGQGRRAEIVRAAVKWRKEPDYSGTHPRTHPSGPDGTHPRTHPPENRPSPAPDPLWDPAGPTSGGDGTQRGSLKGTRGVQPANEGPELWDDFGEDAA